MEKTGEMKRIFLWLCACGAGLLAFPQQADVLLRIDGEDVSRQEFEYAYRKHGTSGGKVVSPRAYADSFVLRRLMAREARRARMDTAQAFVDRREAYAARLLETYLLEKVGEESARNGMPAGQPMRAKIAQVLWRLSQSASAGQMQRAEQEADSLYAQLLRNPEGDFVKRTACCSGDREVRWVEPLQATEAFDAQLERLSVGEVSRPFYTPEGLHLVKLLERSPVPARPQEVSPAALRRAAEELKSRCGWVTNDEGVRELLAAGSTQKTLFAIGGQAYTGADFACFALSVPGSVGRQWEAFGLKSLLDYACGHVAELFPPAAWAMRDWEETWLAAEAVRRMVDVPARTDRAGWLAYFEVNRRDYDWTEPRFDGIVVHCRDRKTARKVRRLLRKTSANAWKSALLASFGEYGAVRAEQGVFARGENAVVDRRIFKVSASRLDSFASRFPCVELKGRRLKGPENYTEVEVQLKADFRRFLYARWARELLSAAKVEINQEVLKTVNNNTRN